MVAMSLPVDSIIFDVANVIVDWRAERALAGVLPPAEIEAFVTDPEYLRLNEATDTDMSLADALNEWSILRPGNDAYRLYVERFPLCVTGPRPGTSELIEDLLTAGVPCFGLSNWSAENFDVARAAAPVLGSLHDLIVSGWVHMAKPHPEIYALAIERFGVDPARTLFVDDTARNLPPAASLGLQTWHFNGADPLRLELVRRGLLVD